MSNRLYNKTSMKKPLWYQVPNSLTLEDWKQWNINVKKDYPVQYFVRELACDAKYVVCRWYRTAKYKIRSIFKPSHQDIRKTIPREWADISSLIVDVNFAMIKSFKKEADEAFVDWSGTENHCEFKKWLDSAAHWIAIGRPNCQAQAYASYPPYPLPDHMRGKSYEELYGEVNKMEKLIEDTDTKILNQMIEYRGYFWT